MTTEVKMPTINVNDDTVSLIRWLVVDGTMVTDGQPICEVETSKTVEEVLCPGSGTIRILQGSGDVSTGAVIALLGESTAVPAKTHQDITTDRVVVTQDNEEPTRFTKPALELLTQRGISIYAFKGRALVRKSDILAFLGEQLTASVDNPVMTAPKQQRLTPSQRRAGLTDQHLATKIMRTPASSPAGKHAVSLPRRKREEIRVLSEGHLTALPSVLVQTLEITGLRAYISEQSTDTVITVASIVTYEVARLLLTFKEFNATYSDQGIVFHEEINIGMAIDGEHGLKVASVYHANEKGITEISSEMEALLQQYLDDTLPAKRLTSATFNISDLSHYDVPWFIPLISQNQSAILGIGLSQHDNRETLSLCLTFDHRVTEGKRAAEFLRELKLRLASYVDASNSSSFGRPTQDMSPPTCSQCFRTADELPGNMKYLLQVVDSRGSSAFVCQQCLEGW